jgi:hypothetical protein
VFQKSVLVEYAGIASDSSLTGRVLLNNADIGAQMIRDGVAWFDPANGNRLSANDREIYQQSEQAARKEKRGLWRDENPVAPWEFVKAEKIRMTPVAVKEGVPEVKPRRSGPVPELNNLTLKTAGMNTGPTQPATSELNDAWARSSARRNWSRFEPPGEDFSVEMPEDGQNDFGPPMADGIKSYSARDGWALYMAVWGKGPTHGQSDAEFITGLARELAQRATKSYQQGKTVAEFDCKPPTHKYISQNGYKGVEVDMTACSVPSRVIAFTKTVDDKRQFYMGLVVFSNDEGENVARFLSSFRVGAAKKRDQ